MMHGSYQTSSIAPGRSPSVATKSVDCFGASRSDVRERDSFAKGAITSEIKHAIKLKTNPARLAQLLQCAVIGCKLKQNANEDCNSCASLAGLVLSFIACFILLVIVP